MTRTSSIAVPLALAYAAMPGGEVSAAKKADQPNVLIIYCDQLAARTLGCYGGGEIGTPNIDMLAREGVMATNFYANTPVSTPSRGCWQSGLYPTEHGAFKNDNQIRQDILTFASELRDHGYATGYAGKWHLDGNPKRPGWDIRGKDMGWSDRRAMYAFGHYKTITEEPGKPYPVFSNAVSSVPEHYPTDWFTDRALEFLGKHKGEPFCYMLSIPDPHGPYLARPPYNRMYPPETMIMPPTLTQPPASDYYLYNETRTKRVKGGDETEYERIVRDLPKAKSEYFGMIRCIDDNVGRIIQFLKANGLYDKTIVVFSADHGDMMGEHARMAKAVPFDASARVPFIVRYPSKIKGTTVTDHVMSAIDFYPTILSLAGTPQTGKTSGRDATGALTGTDAAWDDAVFFRSYSLNYPWVGVVTKEYKLIYGKNDVGGKALLIDRAADPGEAHNRIGEAQYAAVVEALTTRIADYCKAHQDTHWEWLQKRL